MTTDDPMALAGCASTSVTTRSAALVALARIGLEADFLQVEPRREPPPRVRRLDQTELLHQARHVKAEVVFLRGVTEPQELRMVMMVVLQEGAGRSGHRAPV